MSLRYFISYLRKCTLPCAVLLLLNSFSAKAQEMPPRPIAVYFNPAQGLVFGAFFQGSSGGTVTVASDGSRSVTGDIIQATLGAPFSPALFEIDADPGTIVSILNGPDAVLSGNNGGILTLHIGSSNTGSSFITTAAPPGRTEVRIGGTLTVGNAISNPSGDYSGTFSITFIQE